MVAMLGSILLQENARILSQFLLNASVWGVLNENYVRATEKRMGTTPGVGLVI